MIHRTTLAAAILGLSSFSAMADPRQDTLAGISRCAGLPDDRTFLDCVYGAAQPLRAELGLPPAPSFQIRLVPPAPGARALMPPVASTPSTPAMAASAPPAQPINGSGETLRLAAYSFNSHGQFTVTLSNGQVWRQRANDTAFANWGAKPADYYVTVRAQSGGGYILSVRGGDGPYQVEQVR